MGIITKAKLKQCENCKIYKDIKNSPLCEDCLRGDKDHFYTLDTDGKRIGALELLLNL